MEFIRVFANPDRCMQRLGFLKHLIWRASQSATNNLSTLGKDLVNAVSQRVSVALLPYLQEYIKTALTDPIYKNLRSMAAGPLEETSDKSIVQVEKQDIYLADFDIPSRRGKLVKEDWRKYPYLALDLGQLRKGTYSLLVRGQSFLSLVREEERKAFSMVGVASSNGNSNPFRLTMPQRLLLLFSIIDRDGDVINRLYRKLLSLCEPFTDREAGDYLPEIYRAIAKESRPKVRSGDDLSRIQKLLDTATKIEAWKGKPYTGKGARELTVTVRLEPLVDLGLLSKPGSFAYRYQIPEPTKTFFEPLIKSESIEHFLHYCFFDASNKVFNLNREHRADRETILPEIQKAYTVLKSTLGYAPILEVALLAGIYSITDAGSYFEISEAIDTLKSFQKERPTLIRFNVDRWGALTVVKFNSEIIREAEG